MAPPESALDEINEKVLFLCPVLYKNFYTFEYIWEILIYKTYIKHSTQWFIHYPETFKLV